jgi:hypothetical protein
LDPILLGDRVPTGATPLARSADASTNLELSEQGEHLIVIGVSLLGKCGRGEPISCGEQPLELSRG